MSRPLFSWLHLSDIHFGEPGAALRQRKELEAGQHAVTLECDRRDIECEKVTTPTYTEQFTIEAGETYYLKYIFQ